MKISVMSDLHLEFERSGSATLHGSGDIAKTGILSAAPETLRVDADLVILAGDVHVRDYGPKWAASMFRDTPVVMLGGNHESYQDSLYANIARNRATAAAQGTLADGTPHVSWLERETFTWATSSGNAVRVIGCTLWTDFDLFGEHQREKVQRYAAATMNDFRLIHIRDDALEPGATRRFHPRDAARIHDLSVDFIMAELGKSFDGITVVATHHAPSPRSVTAQYHHDPLSAAFASDLESVIALYRPHLWVHGHMHTSFDYLVGATRVVCNPRGYWPSDLNQDFEWGKTIVLEI